jgi:hypothetical protein
MAYERRDEALRQLKIDRERAEATEKQQKKTGAGATKAICDTESWKLPTLPVCQSAQS